MHPSFSPSVPTSVHPYLHPSLSQHIHRYPSLSVSPLIHPFLPWSVCPYIPTSLHPCPCLSVRPYLCPSIPQISMQYNPGWNGSSVSSVNVLHVRAVGRGDSLHYVWSSIGAPSVLLVATSSPSSALSIDWSRLLSPAPAGAVWIEPPGSVVHAAAVVFTKLFEYSKADASEAVFYPSYDLSNFSWDSINRTVNHTALTAELRGVPNSDPGSSFSNGSLAFRVTAYGSGGRDGAPPGLLHTANSSKVEFVLAGAAPRGNGSRFVLEVTTVQERGAASRLHSARSIDDEYTPTIFKTLSLVAESQNGSSALSFLQWKATAYGSRHPTRADGIQCHAGGLRAASDPRLRSAVVRAYFGDGAGGAYSVSAINVSFGGEDGGAYQEKRYLSWSALLGFGPPPEDSFSPLIISIAAAALGAPLLLLLLGAAALLCAKRRRYSEYEPIN
ncbi:glycosylated lysosomal membrane protein isoform X1 [Lagopus leucura]|uniref:glycosylated lysosomal membrane protein isoform X1 n=1 Tax=Lagopus leucura TaxID=30410 RepID=UPI001C67CDCA|nr:glycosylated lysosomal membrane protein isoform X1 [Lagopus leucura]